MVACRNEVASDEGLETTGALLRDVARLHVRAQRKQVACCGTTVAQCHILTELERAGPLQLTELGARLGVHKGWISRGVASLVDEGLVERGGTGRDERIVVVRLSAAGQRRVAALNRALDRHAARVLGRIPAPERGLVRKALALVGAALREELGSGGAGRERRRGERRRT